MSAKAIELFESLRSQGIADGQARAVAEAFDASVKEAVREAKEHSDRNRAESEGRADDRFVSRDEYHERDRELATRGDIAGVKGEIAELRKDIAAVHQRIDGLYRILVGILITVVGVFAAVIGGMTTLIWKLFGL